MTKQVGGDCLGDIGPPPKEGEPREPGLLPKEAGVRPRTAAGLPSKGGGTSRWTASKGGYAQHSWTTLQRRRSCAGLLSKGGAPALHYPPRKPSCAGLHLRPSLSPPPPFLVTSKKWKLAAIAKKVMAPFR